MMLFYTFESQQQRRKLGGSAFIEMQFCRLPLGTATEDIVAVGNIENWRDDSLYIKDDDTFYREYSRIFAGGVYNNLQHGVVDIYGINYYSAELTDHIIKRITEDKPADHMKLLKWLEASKAYNGFYILGI